VNDVTVEQRIDRPRPEVAAFTADPRNDTRWIRALTDVELVTSGPFGVGSQVRRVAAFLGRRMEYVLEVAEHEPGRRLAMRSVKAPFPMTVVYEWEDAGQEATLMRIRTGGQGGRFYKVAGPLLAASVRRGVAGDLAQLRRVLEDPGDDQRGGAPAGA
jgi:hypothetical protein